MSGTGIAHRACDGVMEEGVVHIENEGGASPFVIICDHASHWLPKHFDRLGLEQSDLLRHIGWDPGALPVASTIARLLDAPLVAAGVSRLAIDCNRPLDAADLIPPVSETTTIPGNATLTDAQRAERIALSWQPFHDAIDKLVRARIGAGRDTRLVSVHSFNPVYKGIARPWEIGVLHDEDESLSAPLLAALSSAGRLTVGDNQPYSPTDNVYFTLQRHGRSRNLPCAMLEIRNDEIADGAGQARWAELLARLLAQIELDKTGDVPAQTT